MTSAADLPLHGQNCAAVIQADLSLHCMDTAVQQQVRQTLTHSFPDAMLAYLDHIYLQADFTGFIDSSTFCLLACF